MTRLLLVFAALWPAADVVHAGQATVQRRPDTATAKALFCAHGGIGRRPDPLPAGYEIYFAVAVIEVDSRVEVKDVAVTDFTLLDDDGKLTTFTRVVTVEEFNRPRVATEGEAAYYLNPGGTLPWSGTLPAGPIRLRVRVSLPNPPLRYPYRFRLTLGPHSIEGSCNVSWPTLPSQARTVAAL